MGPVSIKLVCSVIDGSFKKEIAAETKKMQTAEESAVRDAGELAKQLAKQAIAGGGFGTWWQSGVKLTKLKKDKGEVYVTIYDRIRISTVFEKGTTINGEPVMWIPTDAVPKGKGNKQLTPKQYVARLGQKLVSVNLPGHPPMLLGPSTGGIVRATVKSVKIRKKRGSAQFGNEFGDLIPLYIGIATAKMPVKYNVTEAIKKGAEEVLNFLAARMGK
jgi:hypothetical protein